jgi:hypothetical protein
MSILYTINGTRIYMAHKSYGIKFVIVSMIYLIVNGN